MFGLETFLRNGESLRLCFGSHNAFITLIELLLTLNVIKRFVNDDKKVAADDMDG